jgi:KDO2-lipid IV(A) lauroyltransferase
MDSIGYFWALISMQALSFYLAYPFMYLVGVLPFSVLYRLSDLLYYLLRLTGYRKAVIRENLEKSFPEKSPAEIEEMVRQYLQYMCDLILEILKTRTMTAREASERCVFHKEPWLDKLFEEKKSIVIYMGHHGNWEWAGPSFSLSNGHQLVVIYLPLSNRYFDRMMVKMRTKFGTRIAPSKQTLRTMATDKDKVTATAFIADQAAPPGNSYWTTFLHQDTSVFTGHAKMAIRFNYPVVFLHVKRTKRGYYDAYPELLFDQPKNVSVEEICESFIKRLEKEIIQDPIPWLWSHRRWKHARPALKELSHIS